MLDGEGRPWLLDYAYAQDGLDIWRELEAYFGKYLRLYYKSDAEVLGDVELQAWWQEIKVGATSTKGVAAANRCRSGHVTWAMGRAWVVGDANSQLFKQCTAEPQMRHLAVPHVHT